MARLRREASGISYQRPAHAPSTLLSRRTSVQAGLQAGRCAAGCWSNRMTAASHKTVSLPGRHAPRWIISRPIDLSLIIGSSLAGYVYLLLFTALHVPVSWLWWFWSVGFDGTHIFGTASRTFFDSEARARHPQLLYGSLLFFFAIGPVMVLAGAKGYLALLVGTWAYYHVVRQHYGFLVMYKVKNRDTAPRDNVLDRALLSIMLIFPPFHRFFIHHPEELGLPFSVPRTEPALWVIAAATLIT